MSTVTDDDRPSTLLARTEAAGISDARQKIESGHVRMGEDIVTDPDCPAPWPQPYVII